ncbi:MAG: fumarylacetoacetate hydrolase family protein [Bacillota bacterium]|nr:fumarylacetoacetate hydrolase family protein [Bacillota bacterium]
MKILRFLEDQKERWGIFKNDSVMEIIWEDEVPGDYSFSGKEFSLDNIKLLSPCAPTKVICIGLNYRSHAEEFQFKLPAEPIIFLKPSTAVIGTGESIYLPAQSQRVDYEAEFAVVIGKKARHVSAAQAYKYIWGYTCANDVTARDLQPQDGQWTYSKSFDTFSPIGPWIETEIEDPYQLEVVGLLNGVEVQRGQISDLIFNIEELIEYISGCMTLLPGDVIMTGTPAGIGQLNEGDIFTVNIDQIGKLQNSAASE